jgi:putative endonuclease
MGGWTYIMTNRRRGTLYIGVTANLPARISQHRAGKRFEFCRSYKLKRLVLTEQHATMIEAIAREKALKEWNRDWKIELIEAANPDWEDLFQMINA